jgi:hypothetical protein
MMRLVVAFLLAVMSLWADTASGTPGATLHAPSSTVTVQVDRTVINTSLGERFRFTSTISNVTGQPTSGLIAHLSVFATDSKTYVDPEDWSSHRTQFVNALQAHGSATLTWPVQAVNSGQLVVYVAVTDLRARRVNVSDPINLNVSRRQTLNAAGILPLAIGMPLSIGILLAATLWRRRRLA